MRLVGINIPDNKRIVIALTYVYGIGHSLADQILKSAKIDLNKRAKDLTSEETVSYTHLTLPTNREV